MILLRLVFKNIAKSVSDLKIDDLKALVESHG